MNHRCSKFSASEKGQALVEYALIIVLISVVSIIILAVMGPAISNVYCELVTTLGGTCDSGGPDAGGEDAGGMDSGGMDSGGMDAGGMDSGGMDSGGG